MDLGRGVMAVWNDLAPGHEQEFDAWYQRQHVPERLSVPGFREARRYVADLGSPRYCAFYWLDDVHVLTTPRYLERLANPTRWTQRMMPHFRNMARSPCTVTLDRGSGLGGTMTWIAGFGRADVSSAWRAELSGVFDACCGDPAIVRLQLWERDPQVAGLANPEQRLRSAADDVAAWVVFIDGAADSAVAECVRQVDRALGSATTNLTLVHAPTYRLVWCARSYDAPPPCSDDAAGVIWSAA